jgi:Esterase/lipase
MQIKTNIIYGNPSIERQKLDIYMPETLPKAVFVYFHGGGIESGDKSEQLNMAALTENGIGVVIPNYRMYPNASYPQFLNDAAQAVAWTYDNYKDIKIYVGGSSAGAYMAMMLAFDKRYLSEFGIDSDSVSGYVFDAAQPTAHFNILRELGIDTRRVIIDDRAPLYHITGDRNYPPMLVICADNDIKSRYEQTLLFMSTLDHFGYGNKAEFKLMKGYNHCEYTSQPVFCDMVSEFILK